MEMVFNAMTGDFKVIDHLGIKHMCFTGQYLFKKVKNYVHKLF